jgi:glycosyltransferase involved in cell wall biosynthesis
VEREYVRTLIEPRLGPDVTIFGTADATAKRNLLARAAALVFPIQWDEPFGMVMIEAMACGTPVVALRRGAVPEVVVDGVTGIVLRRPRRVAGRDHRRPPAVRGGVPGARRELLRRSDHGPGLRVGVPRSAAATAAPPAQ